jgi:hypothetical protein
MHSSSLEIRQNKILSVFMFLAGIFIMYVAFYGARVMGASFVRLIQFINGLFFTCYGTLKLLNPEVIIIFNEIRIVNAFGVVKKIYSYAQGEVVVHRGAVYYTSEDGKFLKSQKIFSFWATDTNSTKLKTFFEAQSI